MRARRRMRVLSGVLLVLLLGLFASPAATLWPQDPLIDLETQARAFMIFDAGSRPPTSNDHYWSARKVQRVMASVLGVTVTYEPQDENVGGRSNYDKRTVVIESKYSWDMRLIVLGHEGGHMLQPPFLDEGSAEVFADGVSYLVARSEGWDASYEVARHVAMYRGSLKTLHEYSNEIHYAAFVLTGRQP